MSTKDGLWVPCGRTGDTKFVVDTLNKGDHYKFRVKVSRERKEERTQTSS